MPSTALLCLPESYPNRWHSIAQIDIVASIHSAMLNEQKQTANLSVNFIGKIITGRGCYSGSPLDAGRASSKVNDSFPLPALTRSGSKHCLSGPTAAVASNIATSHASISIADRATQPSLYETQCLLVAYFCLHSSCAARISFTSPSHSLPPTCAIMFFLLIATFVL